MIRPDEAVRTQDPGTARADVERGEPDTSRERDPFEHDEDATAVQAVLPLDLDAPIPFELTARARRAVAPASLPALEVVDEVSARPLPDDLQDDPADTRPARARALRRAGMSVAGIASELGVESPAVTAWIDDLEPVASARRRLRAVDGGRVAAPRDLRAVAAAERARQQYEEVRG
ncbi:MAG: hypothetical protein R3320_02920, partial [Nitriliruptorales bacterium]|nr:hypothetical protein [Nitriliruptorales bacterium]